VVITHSVTIAVVAKVFPGWDEPGRESPITAELSQPDSLLPNLAKDIHPRHQANGSDNSAI
jgi:hypothetical protein